MLHGLDAILALQADETVQIDILPKLDQQFPVGMRRQTAGQLRGSRGDGLKATL